MRKCIPSRIARAIVPAAAICLAEISALAVTPEEIAALVPRSPLPLATDYTAITANGATIVAFTNFGGVAVSSDRGERWIAAPSIPAVKIFNPPTAAVTDGTRHVVVSIGFSYVSTDLENWTPENRIGGGGYDVAFGEDRFVTVGRDGEIFRSPDGEVWTAATTVPTSEDLATVAYGGGSLALAFVAGGSGGQLLRSDDGDAWDLVFDAGNDTAFTHVSYANEMFLAAGPQNTLYTSPDGTTWTARDLSSITSGGGLADIVYDGSRYVISQNFGSSISSPDLATFTDLGFVNNTNGRVNVLAETSGSVISAGRLAHLATLGGSGWTERSSRLGEEFNSVVFANGEFFIADSSQGRIFSSRTGSVWTFLFDAPDNGNFRSPLTFGNGVFTVAIGNDSVATSPDGTMWTVSDHGIGGVTDGLAFVQGRFVLFGRGGVLASSTDGTNWTASTIPGDFEPQDIAFGAGRYVLAGRSEFIYTSTDFVTWTPRSSGAPAGAIFQGVEFVGSRFVALRSNAAPSTSTDGITWTQDTGAATPYIAGSTATDPDLGIYVTTGARSLRYFPDPTDLSISAEASFDSTLKARGLAEGNGLVVLVGSDGLILSTPGEAAGYEGWAVQRFPLGAADTAPADDFDSDGQANLVEYARGTDPTAATPTFLAPPVQTNFGPEITWSQRANVAGLEERAEFSFDLATWSSAGILPETIDLGGGMERVTARLTGPAGTRSPLYFRIRWTLVP